MDNKCKVMINNIGNLIGSNIKYIYNHNNSFQPINVNLMNLLKDEKNAYIKNCKESIPDIILSYQNKTYNEIKKTCLINDTTPSKLIKCVSKIEKKYPIMQEGILQGLIGAIIKSNASISNNDSQISSQVQHQDESSLPKYQDKTLYI